MVQAALGTAIGGLGAGLSALKTQSRREVSRPQLESATPYIAASTNPKAAKKALENAREERLFYLLSQPEVLGMVVTLGGIILAQNIPFSSNTVVNELAQATATSAAVLMGLGHAGVGDLTTAIVAGLSVVASLLSGISLDEVLPETDEVRNAAIKGSLTGIFPPLGLLRIGELF